MCLARRDIKLEKHRHDWVRTPSYPHISWLSVRCFSRSLAFQVITVSQSLLWTLTSKNLDHIKLLCLDSKNDRSPWLASYKDTSSTQVKLNGKQANVPLGFLSWSFFSMPGPSQFTHCTCWSMHIFLFFYLLIYCPLSVDSDVSANGQLAL